MKRFASVLLTLLFVCAPLTSLLAGDSGQVEMTGWIADEWCNKANANAEGIACAKKCAADGSDMVLVSDGKVLKLSDKKLALEHLGHEVVVTGKLAEDGKSIEVVSIRKADDEA